MNDNHNVPFLYKHILDLESQSEEAQQMTMYRLIAYLIE